MRRNEVFLTQLDNGVVSKVPGSFSRFWHELVGDFPPFTKVVTAKESSFSCSIITTSHRIIITQQLQPGLIATISKADNQGQLPICASIPFSHFSSVLSSGVSTTGVTVTFNFYYPLQLNLFVPVGQNPQAVVDQTVKHWCIQVRGVFLRPMSIPLINAAKDMKGVGQYADIVTFCDNRPTFLRSADDSKGNDRWTHYSISRTLLAMQKSGGALRAILAMGPDQSPEALAEPLVIHRYLNIKAHYNSALDLGDSPVYIKASIDSLLGGEVDALKELLECTPEGDQGSTVDPVQTHLHICVNKDYQVCETYPYLLLLPNQAIIRPNTFVDNRFLCVAGFIDGLPIFRSGNPILGIGANPIADFLDFYMPSTRYKRAIVFSLGPTTYYDIQKPVSTMPPNSNGIFIDYANYLRVLQTKLPFPEELAMAFNTMWSLNLVQPTQFFSSELPVNWNLQQKGEADLYSVAADLFDTFHIKTIKEDNDFQYTVRVEESGWLDYVISFVATARLLVELLRDDNCQNMIILSGDLEVFWTPVILILSTIIANKRYRTINGLLELMRQYLPSFGLPIASCMNFEGSQLEAKAPIQEQHYRLITQRAGHVPIIPILMDCISLLVHYSRPAFGFGEGFLMHLSAIIYSNIYGDFLFDSEAERYFLAVPELTDSLYSQETIELLCKRFETPIVVDSLELSSWPTISKFWSLGLDFS